MKANIQKTLKRSWAVKIDGLERQDFLALNFNQQINDAKKVQIFKETALVTHVDAKGKATLNAVKNWLKDTKPKQFFANWNSDSTYYKDDNVQIWYK